MIFHINFEYAILVNKGREMPAIVFEDGYYTIYEMENEEMIGYIID